jgi:hypothetical protein
MVGIHADPESLLKLRRTAGSRARAWKNNGQTRAFEMVELISRGAGCQEKPNPPVRGEVFLLDIPFHRTLFREEGFV